MSTTDRPAIRVEHLTCAYDDRTILEDVTFDVGEGEVIALLGPSGCGKSTLMLNMIGLYEAVGGHVWIGDEDVVGADAATIARIRRSIGVGFQSGALFGSMTLLENVRLPLEEYTELPPDALDAAARLKLELVGLGGAEHQLPAQLSGGMQKRAAISRALALDPRIVFLDEPSAGLDPITSAALDRLILELVRGLGLTFVVVTHELPSIFAIADRAVMLDGEARSAIAIGTPRELSDSDDPRVRKFFRRELEEVGA